MSDRATEPASPRRLARARQRGDHPTSLAVTRVAGLIAAAAVLPFGAAALANESRELFGLALRSDGALTVSDLALRAIGIVTPMLGAVAAFAAAAGAWQTGGVVSSVPLEWSWQRISPLGALRRFASPTRLWAALSLLIVLGLLGWLAFSMLETVGHELTASIGDPERAALLASEICQRLLWWTVALGVGLALLDALVQRGAWLYRHRMTREEVQREQRELEGDPALRQERRREHRELTHALQLSLVPSATLIVFDGPHVAVALRYDPLNDRAPIVLLSAHGARASTVRDAAEIYAVPICDDPGLARILARVPVDTAIPSSAFAAVAEALRPWLRADSASGSEPERAATVRAGPDTSA